MSTGTSTRSTRGRMHRPKPPEGVQFPVTPMLDMAFQLLAFFVLTFQAPSAETHLDLDLPASPVALPNSQKARDEAPATRQADTDLENDLWIRAEADELGDLKALRLGDSPLPDLAALGQRLARYVEIMESRPLRVRLVADDRLRYEEAARVVATCSAAGVSTIRLTDPASLPPEGATTPRGLK